MTRIFNAILLAAFVVVAAVASAQAQTRTWVSGVGDDLNPCSRTAPCKTFAGAISKTADGGEINTLDPGGFGAVTITKSITIANDGTGTAGVLTTLGTNGIIVNGAGVVVTLRGLDIEGVETGLRGVYFLNGAELHVQNCTIRNFNAANGTGILFAPSSAAKLYVTDSIIQYNGTSTTGGGIIVRPTGSGGATAVLTRVNADSNATGFKADASGGTGFVGMTVQNSSAAGATQHGIWALGGSGGADVFVQASMITGNAGNGLRAEGAGGRVFYSGTTITNNGVGVNPIAPGQAISNSTNQNRGNVSQGAPTSTTAPD